MNTHAAGHFAMAFGPIACLTKRAHLFVSAIYPLRSLLHPFVRIGPDNIISSELTRRLDTGLWKIGAAVYGMHLQLQRNKEHMAITFCAVAKERINERRLRMFICTGIGFSTLALRSFVCNYIRVRTLGSISILKVLGNPPFVVVQTQGNSSSIFTQGQTVKMSLNEDHRAALLEITVSASRSGFGGVR